MAEVSLFTKKVTISKGAMATATGILVLASAMKACTVFLHTDNTVRQGLELLRHHGYTAIPVLNDKEEYLGTITEGDFLHHILAVNTTDLKAHEKYRIASLLRPDFCPPLGIGASAAQVVEAVMQQNFVPIVAGGAGRSGGVAAGLFRQQIRTEPRAFFGLFMRRGRQKTGTHPGCVPVCTSAGRLGAEISFFDGFVV